MTDIINLEDWLEAYATGTDTIDTPAGNPAADPYNPAGGGSIDPAASPKGDPNISNMPPEEMDSHPDDNDPSSDPQNPDMPEDKEHLDYEQWKKQFLISAIKGDVQEMKELLNDVTNRDLDSYQRKFVDDNLNIVQLREYTNIEKASKEIKKMIKDNLDHNNPGTSLAEYITQVLDTIPLLNPVFIKLSGMHGQKADLHRKYIASLTGSIQVGSGGNAEDLIYNDKDYSIRISTRMNARFGDCLIGSWNLRADDPERYLKPPEIQRLHEGSPEEKDALKKRVIIDSISETWKTRAFIINVVGTDGTIYTIGWDIATSLKAAFTEGKILVKTKNNDGSEAMIDKDGAIITFDDMKIVYVKETGETDEDGKPVKREMEFINKRQGQLFLTAQLGTLKGAASSFPGIKIKETPWQGNPSDLRVLQRCVPSALEILMRTCG
jgi:hypothetical protein